MIWQGDWVYASLIHLFLVCPYRRGPEPGPQPVGGHPCGHWSPENVFPWASWTVVSLQVVSAACRGHQWVRTETFITMFCWAIHASLINIKPRLLLCFLFQRSKNPNPKFRLLRSSSLSCQNPTRTLWSCSSATCTGNQHSPETHQTMGTTTLSHSYDSSADF